MGEHELRKLIENLRGEDRRLVEAAIMAKKSHDTNFDFSSTRKRRAEIAGEIKNAEFQLKRLAAQAIQSELDATRTQLAAMAEPLAASKKEYDEADEALQKLFHKHQALTIAQVLTEQRVNMLWHDLQAANRSIEEKFRELVGE